MNFRERLPGSQEGGDVGGAVEHDEDDAVHFLGLFFIFDDGDAAATAARDVGSSAASSTPPFFSE